jgi:hypothetical protein
MNQGSSCERDIRSADHEIVDLLYSPSAMSASSILKGEEKSQKNFFTNF